MRAHRVATPVVSGPAISGPIVLGIDPGLLRTGYAIVRREYDSLRIVDAGVIRLNPRARLEERLVELQTCLQDLLDTHRPRLLACEELYAHYKHPRTAILMGHARGVILALARRAGLEILPVSATHVKKTLTGSGRAGKPQVQRAVTASLRLARPPQPFDVSDALAIALCGLHSLPAADAGRTRRGAIS